MILNILFLVLGFILLVKGADVLVEGGGAIAKRLKVPNIVIGLTIVAFGTSAPEFVVSALAAYNGSSSLALGNIVGSVVTNTLLGLGLAAVLNPFKLKKGTVWKEIPFSLLAIIVVLFLANDQLIPNAGIPQLSRLDGAVLLSFFAIFMYYTFGITKASGDASELEEVSDISEMPMWKSLSFIALGLTGLAIGGDMIVNQATSIASALGLTEKFVALLIIGPGTSLPEIATVFIAARKKQIDLAVGGIIGSNIFNVFLIIGASAVIGNMAFDVALNADLLLILGVNILLFLALFIGKRHHLERWQGISLLVYYLAYIVYLFVRG